MRENEQPFKVLIVDDVQLNLDLMKEILSPQGYLIATAKNGKSAIAKAKAHKFDLILLDIILPDIDGFEVCAHLKSIAQTQDIPIVFLTAKNDKENLARGFQLGAADYIPKPFTKEELVARVNLHLSLRRTQEELIRLKEMAEAAKQTKSSFLANMSHEFRAPMNGIVGLVEILKRTTLTDEQLEFLEIIEKSGQNLLARINDMLDFSKIDTGQITFESIRFLVNSEVGEVIKMLDYKADQKRLKFSYEIAPNVPEMIIGDPLRLKQVLIILCNNAFKYTHEGFVKIRVGVISSSATRICLKFEVEDSGIGISPANPVNLLMAVSQADSSTARKLGDKAVGLAISKNMVQLMNGTMGVISEEGKGSVFYFDAEFGLTEQPISVAGSKEIDPSDSSPMKFKILLAEDNLIVQKVVVLNLEKMGHQVSVASDGKKAVELFRKQAFDVIFMDVQMPEMDGLQATIAIREWEKGSRVKNPIPIVAMTATTQQKDKDSFMVAGMNDYLPKPFKTAELALVLDRIGRRLKR